MLGIICHFLFKMTEFKKIPLSLFAECQEKLSYNEMIFTNDMNAFESMSALDVGKPKIDCHMMAKGIYTIKELLDNGFYLPDEKITNDEIRKICGYFLDVLEARMDGNTVYQTTLMCTYMHKEYEIKNPFLKAIIQSFSAISCAIEKFVNGIVGSSLSYWAHSEAIEEIVQKFEIPEIKKALKQFENDETKDIIAFCGFLIEFAEFLEKFPGDNSVKIPELPQFIEESENIGFTENLHLRDLTTRAPPTKLQIKEHKIAVELFKKAFEDMKEIIALPKPNTVVESITQASNWSFDHQDTLMFVRLVRIGMALGFKSDTQYFYGNNIVNIFKKELAEFHTADNVFAHVDFKAIASNIRVFLLHAMRALYLPYSHFCSTLSKTVFQLWSKIQESNINVEMNISRPRPKTKFAGTEQILKTTISTWGEFIGAQLGIEFVKHYFRSGCLLNDDMPFISLVLESAYSTIANAYEKKRTIDAIYSVFEHRKGSKRTPPPMSLDDIDKRKKPESPEELTAKGMQALWGATYNATKFCVATKALKPKESMFFNPLKLYENRYSMITKLREVKIMNIQQYEFSQKQPESVASVQKKYTSARSNIKKAMDDDAARAKENKDYKPHSINKLMAMCSIQSPAILAKRKDEQIKFDIDGNMLPVFKLVSE